MKKYLFIIILAAWLHSNAHANIPVRHAADSTLKALPDGRYYGNVAYYNYSSNISAEYTLKLKVKDGLVTVIFLNNGGVLHDGINGEGYQFTGGKLKVRKNKESGKLEYTTQVSISNGATISSYTITIEKTAADDTP